MELRHVDMINYELYFQLLSSLEKGGVLRNPKGFGSSVLGTGVKD